MVRREGEPEDAATKRGRQHKGHRSVPGTSYSRDKPTACQSG